MTTKYASEKAESITALRELLRPGMTVYCVLRHVSRSGMSRRIDFYVLIDNEPRYITYHVGKALGYRQSCGSDGITVGGCGMDMGFHVVHSLGYALWGKEASEGKGKTANALRRALRKASGHYMMQGGRTQEPDATKPAQEWFGASGYALKSQWI